MTEGNGFKHISVTSEDEDDVVIHAGIVQPHDEVDDGGAMGAAAQQDAGELTEGPQLAADDAASRANAQTEQKRAANPSPSQGYRETTLEDLAPTPMSSMQKGIIVFAVVAIAVAVVYYMMFMR